MPIPSNRTAAHAVTLAEGRALVATTPAMVSDEDRLVRADKAESLGNDAGARRMRFVTSDHGLLDIDARHIPDMLTSINPWMLLVDAFSDDEDTAVMGHDCYGIDITDIVQEVFGSSTVSWMTVRFAPLCVQRGLTMMIIAKIRRMRATGRVYHAWKAAGQPGKINQRNTKAAA